MGTVYIVQFDWATPDASGINLYVFGDYGRAYDKFKELICNERNPEMSWVGDIEFDDDGYPVDERWFTSGSKRQYDLLFELNKQGAELETLATIIWICSIGYDEQYILKILIQECDI